MVGGRQLDLLNKGRMLKGEKVTLKELGLENLQTIIVNDVMEMEEPVAKRTNQEIKESIT